LCAGHVGVLLRVVCAEAVVGAAAGESPGGSLNR